MVNGFLHPLPFPLLRAVDCIDAAPEKMMMERRVSLVFAACVSVFVGGAQVRVREGAIDNQSPGENDETLERLISHLLSGIV